MIDIDRLPSQAVSEENALQAERNEELRELTAEIATLTAERNMLLVAANRVLQWFKTYDSEDAAVLNDLTAVVLQVEKRQAEQQQ
jgi:hypothetical protein